MDTWKIGSKYKIHKNLNKKQIYLKKAKYLGDFRRFCGRGTHNFFLQP